MCSRDMYSTYKYTFRYCTYISTLWCTSQDQSRENSNVLVSNTATIFSECHTFIVHIVWYITEYVNSLSLSQNRTQLLGAAGEMGAHGGYLLSLAGDSEVDPKIQEALVAMAKGVASATAALVTNARFITSISPYLSLSLSISLYLSR